MQNGFATKAMSIFQSIGEFSRKSKVIRLCQPEDVLNEKNEWSGDQLLLPMERRGAPARTTLEIRPGAETQDVEIVALSMVDREKSERILDAAIPPQTYIEELPTRPGDIPKKIPSGFDYENPDYLAKLRPLQDRQAAFVVLKGVVGMQQDAPGSDDEAKVDQIMATMASRIVKYLASEILNLTYSAGNPQDFFTREDSSGSPSSEPSPSKNQGE